jgi:hypothetical protein
VVRAAKELHFNKNMEALKKMQAGADKLATVVGVTLGPKVRLAAAADCGLGRGFAWRLKQTHPDPTAVHTPPSAGAAAEALGSLRRLCSCRCRHWSLAGAAGSGSW